MAQPTDHLAGLERQRLQLEESILELKKSLYNWRMWDAEYDELKNDISALDEDSTQDDFIKIGREFGGSLVNEDEIKVLLGVKQGVKRTQQQVADAISRRMDYVQQNIGVLEKRVAAAEKKLDAILTVQQPGAVNEEGLPITDIVEELDEDGCVISSSTTTPKDAAPGILEALKKAGIEDFSQDNAGDKQDRPSDTSGKGDIAQRKTDTEMKVDSSSRIEEIKSSEAISEESPGLSTTARTAPPPSTSTESVVGSTSNAPTVGSKYSNRSSPSETYQKNDTVATEIDELPEDAALRREMLQYGLEEVGAVVAELELDESGSDFSYEDEDYMMSDEDVEEEDEYGRSTQRIISDDYRRQMLELEKKLNARGLENVGPNVNSLPAEIRKDIDAPPVSAMSTPDAANGPKSPKKKKKVAFADTLDIAPEPAAPTPTPPAPTPKRRVEAPAAPVIQEAVVERTEAEKAQDVKQTAPPKKVSRFKSARKAAEPTNLETMPVMSTTAVRSTASSKNTPQLPLFPAKPSQPKPFSQPIVGPDEPIRVSKQTGAARSSQPPKTLADKLVERNVACENVTPPDPDELDENLHRQEIATEFYKIRNRKVQEEGGFLRDEDEENDGIIPLDKEGEPPKKVSRFMAARMK
ncbi:hypothetical protein AJ79_07053 [Helicocarpus griseus UAMH5409]|uniref:DUF3835 domain-containing protein n=1 Tax=Helicocarpus griseus UAMH5409 TaxID=1447875 RepID=A0A2B7X727_9EURO|nr:hypothetical protein AJ79_07053 [Helicocarpus griseus UAMH5409]